VGLADFAASNANGWPTGSISIKKSNLGELYETGGLFGAIHPVSIKKSKLGRLAIRWNFEPAKSADPTRFLSKIDQQLIEGAGDVLQRPREKKPAKVLKNHILFPGTIIVGLSVHVQYVLLVWIVIATATKVVECRVYLRRLIMQFLAC